MVPFNPTIFNILTHFWTKDMGQIVMLLGNILGAHSWMLVASPHFLNLIYIPNFVHHHVWPRLLHCAHIVSSHYLSIISNPNFVHYCHVWPKFLQELVCCDSNWLSFKVVMNPKFKIYLFLHFDEPITNKILKVWAHPPPK